MKKAPEEINLNREEGDALIGRLQADRLSADDRRLLVKLVQLYFWLTFALRETKISLKRLKWALFGKGGKNASADDDDDAPGGPGGGGDPAPASRAPAPTDAATPPADQATGAAPADETEAPNRRRGHGRRGADAYSGAERVVCRHEDLAAGQRCPACGRGSLYALPAGVEIRIDGNALLSAVRYELEKLRCSACGELFTAPLPAAAGQEKYTPRARAVVALSRYYLGLPFYRLEAFQDLVGVPVADATLWDQAERVADCVYPVFEQLQALAAQSPVMFQDDTAVRILALIKENRHGAAGDARPGEGPPARVGMYTTGLVAQNGEHTIVLYLSGRAHAGENLAGLLARRAPELAPPIVMSDALAANELADETPVVRCHCLAHGYRQFDALEEVFPAECRRVLDDLKAVFDHDAVTRAQAMDADRRLAYHQRHSGPLLTALKAWLEEQFAHRLVEPHSSLGKAFSYLLSRWSSVTRFLRVPGAPIENNTVERALKLMIRQRKNSLFFASAHSAYVASMLASIIATCAEAGVNALDYLVAVQAQRAAVFANPAAWLPWNYTAAGEPA
jgi:hypothetical protein